MTITSVEAPRSRKFLGWAHKWIVAIVLVAVGLAVGISNLAQQDEVFSPYDEWVYYDYVEKVPTQGFVHQGEDIGEPALQAMACYGDPYGARGEPCTGENGVYDEPELYPQSGKTSADLYTPVYFAITWLGAQVVTFFTGAELLHAARATGLLWMVSGLIALVLLFRQFRVPRLLQFGLGLATIGLASSHYAFLYISTDAPALVSGAVIALLGARVARTGKGGWWLVVAAVIATLLKITFLFIVAFVAIALVLHALMKLRKGHPFRGGVDPSPARMITMPVIAIGASLIAEVAWLAFRSINSVGVSADQGLATPLSLVTLLSATFVFLVLRDGINADSTLVEFAMAPYSLLAAAGVLGWFFTSRGGGLSRSWSIATAIAAFAFAPLMVVGMQIALHAVAPITPRYALVLAPVILVAIAAIIRNSLSMWIVLAYGSGLSALALFGLVH